MNIQKLDEVIPWGFKNENSSKSHDPEMRKHAPTARKYLPRPTPPPPLCAVQSQAMPNLKHHTFLLSR